MCGFEKGILLDFDIDANVGLPGFTDGMCMEVSVLDVKGGNQETEVAVICSLKFFF